MNEDVKKLAIYMTELEGCDPYQKVIGLGKLMPEGKEYELWESRYKNAERIIEFVNEQLQ